jgi:drug/metabolite transporter (DMT)-like permease
VLLALLSVHSLGAAPGRALAGVAAALGAGLLWGTMYVPYRKAYLSGINPLSFVTIFTFGEVGTMLFLAALLPGSLHGLTRELIDLRPSIFWLLLGGFCWVIGDLFQQYATKYVGISRAIPLSNTNQLWGFAWGVLVFGELAGAHGSVRWLALLGSAITIVGAMLIAGATVSPDESASTTRAIRRECDRYGMDLEETLRTQHGHAEDAATGENRPWWDYLILLAALGVFVWAAIDARIPRLALHWTAALVLTVILVVVLAAVASLLWKKTRFA